METEKQLEDIHKCVKTESIFDKDCYYTVQQIQDVLPYFDELAIRVIYLNINERFLDEEEIETEKKTIEKMKKSYALKQKREFDEMNERMNKKKKESNDINE